MFERSNGQDTGERRISKRQVLGVAADEVHRDAAQLGATARDDEPAHRDVDTDSLDSLCCHSAREIARPGPDVEPSARRQRTRFVQAIEPLTRSLVCGHDVLDEPRGVVGGRTGRHRPVRMHHRFERGTTRSLLESPRFFSIVIEPDPRIRKDAKVGDSEHDRKTSVAAAALIGIGLGRDFPAASRTDEA
jgi:hypothetical protein